MRTALRTLQCAFLFRVSPVLALAAFLTACGGGGGAGDTVPVPVAPSITSQPASQTVQAGQTATFTVLAAGDAPLSYQWLRDSNAIVGAVLSSYTLASPTMADTGSKFAVRVSNAAGTVTSADAVLTVTPPPVVVPPPISIVKAGLGMVKGVGVDAAGNTLFARQDNVGTESQLFLRKMAADGSLLDNGVAGQGISSTQFPFLSVFENSYGWGGSAFDAAGNYIQVTVYVAGGFNLPLVGTGGVISKVSSNGTVTKLVEWPAGSAGAMGPNGLGIGPDGTLYFLDQFTGNLVAWTSQTGTRVLAKLRPPTLSAPQAPPINIAVTADNKIYVMDRALVKRIDGSAVTIVAGQVDGTIPSGDTGFGIVGTSDGTGSNARFFSPTGMVADADGNLLVADLTTIRKVTQAGEVTTVAGIPAASQVPNANSPPLKEGPLTNALGVRVGPIAIGTDGVVHAFVYPTTDTYFSSGGALPQKTLVKIRLR